MSKAQELLRQIRTSLRGYRLAEPGSSMPRRADLGRGRHRFFCGGPGFVFKNTGYALTFEVFAEEHAEGFHYRSFSIHLLNVGEVTIMFHKDPDAAKWPDHPETHIQFEAPDDAVRAAPFLDWRIPLGQIGPMECIEYAVARGVSPDG